MKKAAKKIIQRGRNAILPLTGDIVSELSLGLRRLATFVFQDLAGNESQLEIEDVMTLLRGDDDTPLLLSGSRPGRSPGSPLGQFLSIHGYEGGLIC